MKKCCKNIDITNIDTIMPYIECCIKRHGKRNDFRIFLEKRGLKNEYRQFLAGDNEALRIISVKVAGYISDMIATKSLPGFTVWARNRYDETSRKTRLIGSETVLQRLIDYIVVYGCKELWDRKLVIQQCSSIHGRGQVYGVNLLCYYILSDNRAMKYAVAHHIRYTRKCRYFVKLDIRHCYENIDRGILFSRLQHDIGNSDMLYLWSALFKSYGSVTNGLLIGALPSQYASQYMIADLYRQAMRDKAVTHMLTYMDDMILFSSNRRKLLKSVMQLVEYAKDKLRLTIKPNFSIKKLSKEPIDMMGYVVHANGKVTIRAKVFIHARRLVLRYFNNSYLTYSQAKRLVSYKGYFVHSNCQKISVEYNKAFKAAQSVIRNHERRYRNGLGNINSQTKRN